MNKNNEPEAPPPWSIAFVLLVLGGIVIALVVAFLEWLWGMLVWLVTLALVGLKWFGIGVVSFVGVVFVVALLIDLSAPLRRRIRTRRRILERVARGRRPQLSTFRFGVSDDPADAMLAGPLRSAYREQTGMLPDASTFEGDEHRYAYFKARQIPRAFAEESLRHQVEQEFFSPLHERLIAGDEPALNSWVESVAPSRIVRHPLAATAVLIHTMTLKTWGLSKDTAWRPATIDDIRPNPDAFVELCWLHFFMSPPKVKLPWPSWMPTPSAQPSIPACHAPTAALPRSVLMLPAQSVCADPMIDPDPVVPPASEDEDRTATLRAGAREAREVFSRCRVDLETDNNGWTQPLPHLDRIYEEMGSVVAVHDDQVAAYQELARVVRGRIRLDTFEASFAEATSKPPAQWRQTAWLAKALDAAGGDVVGRSRDLIRNAIRFFVLDPPSSPVDSQPSRFKPPAAGLGL